MPRTRLVRAIGHAVRLGLFVVLGVFAARYLVNVIAFQGWVPAAFFWLLLVTGSLALVWRAGLDFRKALRRLRT